MKTEINAESTVFIIESEDSVSAKISKTENSEAQFYKISFDWVEKRVLKR